MTITELQSIAWNMAEVKGFHNNMNAMPSREATLIRLGLIHTEVSEAMQEAKRHGITTASLRDIGLELADILIRVADLAECLEIPLQQAVIAKLTVNAARAQCYGTPEEA